MIPDSDRGAGKAQIIYPDLSCFPQIGGKYESQLIDLDFPGLEKHFHICTKSTKTFGADSYLPSLTLMHSSKTGDDEKCDVRNMFETPRS